MPSNRRIAANVAAGVAQNVVRVCIQLVMLPLMARLLGPHEMALYVLAIPVISFVLLVVDGGLGDSLAREKSDEHPAWASAFWGLLLGSIVLAGIVVFASIFIGAAAGQPNLYLIMIPLALTLVITALTIVPNARLVRAARFVDLSATEIVGGLLSACVAVTMALNGFGVWAMVAQFVGVLGFRMVVVNVLSPFRPAGGFSARALEDHWGVGSAILGSRLIDLAGRSAEMTIISRDLGASAVGAYGYANQIGRFASDMVGNAVWFNLYVLLIGGKIEDAPKMYLRATRLLAVALLPATFMVALALPTLVPLLFGPKWVSAIVPMMLLVAAYPFNSLGSLQSAIMFNTGRSIVVIVNTVIGVVARLLVVILMYPMGLDIMVAGLAAVYVLNYIGIIVFVSPLIGHRRRDLIGELAGPVIASLMMSAGVYFALGAQPSVLRLLVTTIGGAAFYLAALWALDRKRLRQDVDMLRDLIKKKASKA